MNWNIIKTNITNIIVNLFLLMFIFCGICGIVVTCNEAKEHISSPVEDVAIDSIKYENNKITIEINDLDSIKNAKIVEIKTLSNDSVLDLFYELIRK